MIVNILKKHVAIGLFETIPINLELFKRPEVTIEQLREQCIQLINITFKNNIGFEVIDKFIQEASINVLTELVESLENFSKRFLDSKQADSHIPKFIQHFENDPTDVLSVCFFGSDNIIQDKLAQRLENDPFYLNYFEKTECENIVTFILNFVRLDLLSDNKWANGFTFFHLVGRFGSKEAVEAVLAWAGQSNARLDLLKVPITDNNECTDPKVAFEIKKASTNGHTFFHLVGRFGSKEAVEAVLNWAGQSNARLDLLKVPITDNDEYTDPRLAGYYGTKKAWTNCHTFFHLVGRFGSKEAVEAVLAWAGQTDDRLELLKAPITGRIDYGAKGKTFFHIVAETTNPENIKVVLDWAGQDDARLKMLKTPIPRIHFFFEGDTFFHIVAKTTNPENIKVVLDWFGQDDARLKMLKTPLTGNHKYLNGLTFFHLVGRGRRKENIRVLLNWAEETDIRLALLNIPITGNNNGLNGYAFFHLVVEYYSKENVEAVLEWVTEDSSRLGLLSTAITGNDKGVNGYTFFHLVGQCGNEQDIEAVMEWVAEDSSRLELLKEPITDNDKGWNGYTFFHMVGTYGSDDRIEEVLNWAGQNDARLELLTAAITGNDIGHNGYAFFHIVGKYGSDYHIEVVLNWAGQNDARLELLKAKITQNDSGYNGYTFFSLVGTHGNNKDIEVVLAWAGQNDARLDLLKVPITGNDRRLNGNTFFHYLTKTSDVMFAFIQTLANEGRNLEFMLHSNSRNQSPISLLMGNNFVAGQHDFHKTHNITLLTKIFSQSEFPKGTADDGNCPITQHLLDGQAVVYIQTVDANGVSNSRPFVYSVSGAIQLLCRPTSEANSRQQINDVLFDRS